MPGDLWTMSETELTRLEIIQRVESHALKQREAAKQLGLSKRQTIRLVKKYRREGPSGLISKHRGKKGNRTHSESFKQKVIPLVHKHYDDFGPTLAAEKLQERHNLLINKETLRQWMIAAKLWKGKRQKVRTIHQQRARRPCLGELVQIDGSPHAWFEERGEKCCLLVFIDDATSRLLQLRFEKSETTQGYFRATRDYIERYGRPLSFYNDKHGIFRINAVEAKTGTGETQFSRAMRELGITIICANTPQAKGRVERANSTLQDRLVKELRLEKISDIESANAFLPKFMEAYNQRFSVKAANPADAHRKGLPEDKVLDLIFTKQCVRTLSKNLELSYDNIIYQVKISGKGHRMRYAKVTVCDDTKGQVTLLYKNRVLAYEVFDKKNKAATIVSSKEIYEKADGRSIGHKPKVDHPWRRYKRVVGHQGRLGRGGASAGL